MKEINNLNLRKKTSRDYSMTFKLAVVKELEQGLLTVTGATRKYGIQGKLTVFNWLKLYGNLNWKTSSDTTTPSKSVENKILELEKRVKLLEKQRDMLQKKAEESDKKALFFDLMIDMAEKEFKVPIRRNVLPE